jgi:hypothetical protein
VFVYNFTLKEKEAKPCLVLLEKRTSVGVFSIANSRLLSQEVKPNKIRRHASGLKKKSDMGCLPWYDALNRLLLKERVFII